MISSRASGREAKEGTEGERLSPGKIYVAPGNHHMTVVGSDRPSLRIGDEPPVHFCRPAVDPLFSSVAVAFGPAALGIVLTGMGSDGKQGAAWIKSQGGRIFTQSEESCVVYGMPASVVDAGLSDRIVTLDGMSQAIKEVSGWQKS